MTIPALGSQMTWDYRTKGSAMLSRFEEWEAHHISPEFGARHGREVGRPRVVLAATDNRHSSQLTCAHRSDHAVS